MKGPQEPYWCEFGMHEVGFKPRYKRRDMKCCKWCFLFAGRTFHIGPESYK